MREVNKGSTQKNTERNGRIINIKVGTNENNVRGILYDDDYRPREDKISKFLKVCKKRKLCCVLSHVRREEALLFLQCSVSLPIFTLP